MYLGEYLGLYLGLYLRLCLRLIRYNLEVIFVGKDMTVEELTNRINELYHKSQDVGLSPEELEEQKTLRAEYIANIRANLKAQLDNIEIVD